MQVHTMGARSDHICIVSVLKVDRMATIPWRTLQVRENPLGKRKGIHIFVDRISAVSIPHRLDRSTSRTSSCVSSKPTTGDNLAQAIDIGIKRKRGSKLKNISGIL